MKEITSKTSLAVVLSQLKGFETPKVRNEQYSTEPDIAAETLWLMHMRNELDDKTIADLGSGTGILGLGALLLGAKKAFLVEKDEEAMKIAKENHAFLIGKGYELGEAVFLFQDITEFNENVDVVVENPPFGTKEKHADKVFLEKAVSISNKIWSFHKTSTEKFILAFAKDNEFKVKEKLDFQFPLHKTQDFHTRNIHRIEVTLYVLEKK